jgi:hypothetical protein
MSPFEAIAIVHGDVAGGFSTHDASAAWFDSAAIEMLMLFMLVASLTRHAFPGASPRRPEPIAAIRARWVFVWVGVSILPHTARRSPPGSTTASGSPAAHWLSPHFHGRPRALSQDFSLWPVFASMDPVLSCVVSCTGSGGSIKMFRSRS